MLPPGWEDLDRYVDLGLRLTQSLNRLPNRRTPPSTWISPLTVEPSCQSGDRQILFGFHFGKFAISGALTWHRQMGQLFMMGFDGTSVNPQIRSLIEDYHLGAVLLSAKNLKCIQA